MKALTRASRQAGDHHNLALLAPALIIISITVLRVGQSAGFSFWDDEYPHVFAAHSWLTTGTLSLPSGEPYTRAWPFTLLVAASLKTFGASEFAARLPSVLAGAALLAAVYLVTRKFFGYRAAILATALAALDPFTSPLMIISRMYSLFVLLFFVTAVMLFTTMDRWRKGAPYLAVGGSTLLLTGLAAMTHILSGFLACGVAAYSLFSGYWDLRTGNKAKGWIQLLAAGSIFMAIAGYVAYGGYVNVFPAVRNMSKWYFPQMIARYVLPSTVLAILAALTSIRTHDRPTVFMAAMAFGGLLVQALLFDTWLSPRYVAQYLPFIYILAAAFLLGSVADSKAAANGPGLTRMALSLFLVIFTAILWSNSDLPKPYVSTPNYDLARRIAITSLKANHRQVVITTVPLATKHYMGRADYWLREKRSEFYTKQSDSGKVDVYTGAKLLSNTAALSDLMNTTEAGWIVLDHRVGNLSRSTIDAIRTNSQLIASDRRRLWLYHWDNGHER